MSNIVIVGSGPAGVSAALYAVRAGVQTTVLTKGLRGAGARRKNRKLLRLRPAGLRAGAGTPQHRERPAAGGCNSCRPRPWG